jgi:hypothetical protein
MTVSDKAAPQGGQTGGGISGAELPNADRDALSGTGGSSGGGTIAGSGDASGGTTDREPSVASALAGDEGDALGEGAG